MENTTTMHLSKNGYEFLKSVEGYKNKPYKDTNGLYSVGVGHNGKDVNPNHIYSDAEIAALFEKDKKRFEADVNKIYDKRFMNQNMFDACFSFAYNVGNISNTDLGRMIEKNPYDDRIKDFWKYTYTNGGKNKVLLERRKKEVALYFKS